MLPADQELTEKSSKIVAMGAPLPSFVPARTDLVSNPTLQVYLKDGAPGSATSSQDDSS